MQINNINVINFDKNDENQHAPDIKVTNGSMHRNIILVYLLYSYYRNFLDRMSRL